METLESSRDKYAKELTIGLRAVHLASLLTKQHLLTYQSKQNQVSEETKSDASEVTTADFASQAVLISIVHHAFPDDDFIAEESSDMLRGDGALLEHVWELVQSARGLLEGEVGAELRLPASKEEMMDVIDLGQAGGKDTGRASGGRTWILDPIDGTKTYIRAQQYCVCLALVEQGVQQIGILGCPNLKLDVLGPGGRCCVEELIVDLEVDGGWILSAVQGRGTFLSRMKEPSKMMALEDVIGSGKQAGGMSGSTDGLENPQKDSSDSTVVLQFTDSSASSHISPELHERVFEHFAPAMGAEGRRLSVPAVPEDRPTLALDIWSMQMKYVLLTLRAVGADAVIRCPPSSKYHGSVWDHAGGQLLLAESGGVLTDANGEAFVIDGKTRKLVGNWGICAVRGGEHVDKGGQKLEGKAVHEELFAKVRDEVEKSSDD